MTQFGHLCSHSAFCVADGIVFVALRLRGRWSGRRELLGRLSLCNLSGLEHPLNLSALIRYLRLDSLYVRIEPSIQAEVGPHRTLVQRKLVLLSIEEQS